MRQHDEQLFVSEAQEIAGPIIWCWADRHICLTVAHRSGQFVAVPVLVETELYPWVSLPPASQRSRQQSERCRMHRSHIELTTFEPNRLPGSG